MRRALAAELELREAFMEVLGQEKERLLVERRDTGRGAAFPHYKKAMRCVTARARRATGCPTYAAGYACLAGPYKHQWLHAAGPASLAALPSTSSSGCPHPAHNL